LWIFHPDIELPPYLTAPEDETDIVLDYEDSFARLTDPNEVFEELATLIASEPDGDFTQYPVYLQRVLQPSWIVLKGKKPVGTEDVLWERTREIQRQISETSEEEYAESHFSPAALTRVLQKSRI
jgi:hypothetical protein